MWNALQYSLFSCTLCGLHYSSVSQTSHIPSLHRKSWLTSYKSKICTLLLFTCNISILFSTLFSFFHYSCLFWSLYRYSGRRIRWRWWYATQLIILLRTDRSWWNATSSLIFKRQRYCSFNSKKLIVYTLFFMTSLIDVTMCYYYDFKRISDKIKPSHITYITFLM